MPRKQVSILQLLLHDRELCVHRAYCAFHLESPAPVQILVLRLGASGRPTRLRQLLPEMNARAPLAALVWPWRLCAPHAIDPLRQDAHDRLAAQPQTHTAAAAAYCGELGQCRTIVQLCSASVSFSSECGSHVCSGSPSSPNPSCRHASHDGSYPAHTTRYCRPLPVPLGPDLYFMKYEVKYNRFRVLLK